MLEGRDREIRDLLGLIDAARSHRSSAVLLRGGAGIGKSALLTHVAQQVEPPRRSYGRTERRVRSDCRSRDCTSCCTSCCRRWSWCPTAKLTRCAAPSA